MHFQSRRLLMVLQMKDLKEFFNKKSDKIIIHRQIDPESYYINISIIQDLNLKG